MINWLHECYEWQGMSLNDKLVLCLGSGGDNGVLILLLLL